MRHLIVTRCGLGIKRRSFYETRLKFINLTLARSLRAQTSRNFSWIVGIDHHAPDRIEDDLRAAGVDEILRRDPLLVGLSPIDHEVIAKKASGEPIVVSRVDDDDALNRSFVERTEQAFANAHPLCALTFPRGISLFSNGSVFPELNKWIGAGLSIYCAPNAILSPYSISHKKAETQIPERGGQLIIVDTPDPMWINTRHPFSDSAEWRNFRVKTKNSIRDFEPAHFGLSHESVAELCKMLGASSRTPEPEIQYPRLVMKQTMLRAIKKLGEDDPEQKKILVEVMYAL